MAKKSQHEHLIFDKYTYDPERGEIISRLGKVRKSKNTQGDLNVAEVVDGKRVTAMQAKLAFHKMGIKLPDRARIIFKDGNRLNIKWINLDYWVFEPQVIERGERTPAKDLSELKWLSEYDYDPFTGHISRNGCVVGSEHKGYLAIQRSGHQVRLHRLAFYKMGIDIPKEKVVDHINGCRTDNRWANLRLVSEHGNGSNRALQGNNTSGLAGVSWDRFRGKWHVRVRGETLLWSHDFFEACCKRISAQNEDTLFTERHGR